MSSNFLLELDTATSVAASINGSNSSTDSVTVTLALDADPDVIEVKVWGDIDPTNPANADYAETLGAADWIEFEESFVVVLNPAPGQKTLHVRVRDDVWNEADAQDSIVLGGEITPPAPERPAQHFPPTPPRPRPEPERVTVRSISRVRVRGHAIVRTVQRRESLVRFRSRVRGDDHRRVPVRSRIELRTRVATHGTRGQRIPLRVRSASKVSRIDLGPETLATLDALDLL